MAVIAVGRGQLVLRPEHFHDRRAGRFLADIKMEMRIEFLRLEEGHQVLLETADDEHPLQHGLLACLVPFYGHSILRCCPARTAGNEGAEYTSALPLAKCIATRRPVSSGCVA